MKKKSFAVAFSILLTVALMICMLPVTSSAAEISSTLASALDFYVDFRTESDADIQGNYVRVDDKSDDAVYEEDADLGCKVAAWGDDCYGITYENQSGGYLADYDLTDGITLEAYVYINTDEECNMTFIETAGGCLHLQQYNTGNDQLVGMRCGDTPGAGEGGDGGDAGYSMRNAYANRTLDTGKWIHLIGVSDGETNKFYIDGKEEASVDREQNILKGVNGNTDPQLRVGESVFGSLFGETTVHGKIAYVKLYKAAASEDDIAALYENASGKAAPSGGSSAKPTAEPTEEPTAEPTEEPTPKATEKAEATATPAPASTGMDTTLLIVIIVAAVIILAAVAVLIVVLVKRSKASGEEEPAEEVKPETAPVEEAPAEEAPVEEAPAEEPASEDENKSEE